MERMTLKSRHYEMPDGQVLRLELHLLPGESPEMAQPILNSLAFFQLGLLGNGTPTNKPLSFEHEPEVVMPE